jgi:hypothetical protein
VENERAIAVSPKVDFGTATSRPQNNLPESGK